MKSILLTAIAVALIAAGVALYVHAEAQQAACALLKMHGASDV